LAGNLAAEYGLGEGGSFEHICSLMDRDKVEREVEDVFAKGEPQEFHFFLARCACRIFVATTNYDTLIERAMVEILTCGFAEPVCDDEPTRIIHAEPRQCLAEQLGSEGKIKDKSAAASGGQDPRTLTTAHSSCDTIEFTQRTAKEVALATQTIDLAQLVCGAPEPGSTLTEILDHLAVTLASICKEMKSLQNEPIDAQRLALVGPFLGRSLLEVSFTALLGRLDPFRVLVIREMQMRPDFSHEKRNLASIQWTGDIHSEKKVEDLWRQDRSVKDMTRALLGDYYEHLFWRRAFQSLVDLVPDARGGDWMRTLRLINPDSFIPRMKQQSASIYSTCSKAVHHEFVVPAASYYDSQIKEQLRSAIELVSSVALTANASKDILFALPIESALTCFERIQDEHVIN
jgi:hypothetical protein